MTVTGRKKGRKGVKLLKKCDIINIINKWPKNDALIQQLQLSGTHCRFTFAPRPSVAVRFEQGSRLIFSGCSLSLNYFSSENY